MPTSFRRISNAAERKTCKATSQKVKKKALWKGRATSCQCFNNLAQATGESCNILAVSALGCYKFNADLTLLHGSDTNDCPEQHPMDTQTMYKDAMQNVLNVNAVCANKNYKRPQIFCKIHGHCCFLWHCGWLNLHESQDILADSIWESKVLGYTFISLLPLL